MATALMSEGGCPAAAAYVSLAGVLGSRASPLPEPHTWAVLCQAVQALQDLFLSDGVSGGRCVPLLSPAKLLLTPRGRVTLSLSRITPIPQRFAPYIAPEYHPQKSYTDTDIEKMLVYSLGECLKRASCADLSNELRLVLGAMSRQLPNERASIMHLLAVISDHSKKRQQSKPFSHLVMDLYRETIIYGNSKHIIPDCALSPHMKQHLVQPCSDRIELLPRVENIDSCKTISRKWNHVNTEHLECSRLTRNIFTSLEHIHKIQEPRKINQRPKSICTNDELHLLDTTPKIIPARKRHHMKRDRNPVKRAASRLYHASNEADTPGGHLRDCVGPEFVVRASLPNKQLVLENAQFGNTKQLIVIMLNGLKLEVTCKVEATTAGQLFEKIIRSENIEENYFLGLSILISGDFVFLPSDVKLSKIISSDNTMSTLFVRIRFFLPSLRGLRSQQTRHLLYLQLRRSILENQLPCAFEQLCELGGLALQAEFGDFSGKHESNHYFLVEHYIPEILIENTDISEQFRRILTQAHIQRRGLSSEKAEEDFILFAQSLPYYGVHFYSATLISKNTQLDIWLCVSAQGISLFERKGTVVPSNNPSVYEIFKWQSIQTLCYSKHYLCILPHVTPARKPLPRKYKLKMDHKKSYYTFRLASLHHQFFLRLRTEFNSLQSLSQQFGVLLKDIKNETNSLFKLASHNQETQIPNQDLATWLDRNQFENRTAKCKRSKSVNELTYSNIPLEEFQNKENENPTESKHRGYVEHGYISNNVPCSTMWDKRKGVKMGTRAFCSNGQRVSRSLETVNACHIEQPEKMSLHSSSRLSNTSSGNAQNADVYVLYSSIKSLDDGNFLPDFQETLSQSLIEKLKNLSFADERILKSVTVYRDVEGSLGIQVTEGSDGRAYIQAVVPLGPASRTGNIFKGDQIIAVDGRNLLNLKYSDALEILKKTDNKVELVLSQISHSTLYTPKGKTSKVTSFMENENVIEMCNSIYMNERNQGYQPESLTTKTCECSTYNNLTQDFKKYNEKSIEHECERRVDEVSTQTADMCNLKRLSSCSQVSRPNIHSSSSPHPSKLSNTCSICTNINYDNCDTVKRICHNVNISNVALPRSLGLGRRWRGPVRYPVTPIKTPVEPTPENLHHTLNTSDEEQIFI